MNLEKMLEMSQCSNCEETFRISSENVLFCSSKCEEEHDLFQQESEERFMTGKVTVSRLSEEELAVYRSRPNKYQKTKRPVDWRWPGGKMSKEQIEWQRKIIREEYVNDQQHQLPNTLSLRSSQEVQKRRSKRIK